jgi:hypothetical protein
MNWEWIKSLIGGGAVETIGKVIDKIPDADERKRMELSLQELIAAVQSKILDQEMELLKSKTELLQTEMQGSKLQRNWRPIMMLAFGFIVCYNYWFAPTFGTPTAVLPDTFWNLLQISIGGYVIGRSGEKIVPELVKTLRRK